MGSEEEFRHLSDAPQGKIACSKRLYKEERKAQRRIGWLRNCLGLLVLVLILLFCNNYFNLSVKKYTKDQVIETMTKVSVSISSEFSARICSWYDDLHVIHQFVTQHSAEQHEEDPVKAIPSCLSSVHFAMFEDVGILTADGDLILSSEQRYTIGTDPALQEFLQNKPARSCITSELPALQNKLIFIIPFTGAPSDGSLPNPIVGIFGTVSKATVANLLATNSFGANYAYIVISDDQGNVIVDTESKRRFGNNLIDTFRSFAPPESVSQLVTDLKNGSSATVELMGVTERFIMYYTPVESAGNNTGILSEDAAGNWRLMILTSTTALNKSIAAFSLQTRVLLYVLLSLIAILLLGISIYMARKNRKLLVKESTDRISGLLNSPRFKADANLLLKHPNCPHYAIASLNIIHFKMLNSKLGHHRADEILTAVGKNIQAFLLENELAARTYSDHYAVLLNMDTPQGEERLYKLKEHLESATYPFDTKITLTMGVYHIKKEDRTIILPLDYARYAQLSINSDDRQSKGVVYYDDEAFERHKKEIQLTEMALHSLSKNEFVVYYQLKRGIGSKDGWVGCEALVRWGNDKFGFLSPAAFVDLFERNGFIIQLDHYVFETVCSDLRKSIDAGQKVVPVSVNLSKRHFEEEGFLDYYEAILEKYRIPRDLIEFEITETMAVNNTKQVQDAVERIHQMGCSCALDDFGTGYSSFDMVMSISLDTIKLDASLFRNAHSHNKSRRLIVETLIDLSHKLGMRVIAEGIETKEQAQILAEMQCDAIQGYLYAKPMPFSDFRQLLDREELE